MHRANHISGGIGKKDQVSDAVDGVARQDHPPTRFLDGAGCRVDIGDGECDLGSDDFATVEAAALLECSCNFAAGVDGVEARRPPCGKPPSEDRLVEPSSRATSSALSAK